jgi:hypothetical protein
MAVGLPHSTTEDIEYKGYQIPKGTTIQANIWCVSNLLDNLSADRIGTKGRYSTIQIHIHPHMCSHQIGS